MKFTTFGEVPKGAIVYVAAQKTDDSFFRLVGDMGGVEACTNKSLFVVDFGGQPVPTFADSKLNVPALKQNEQESRHEKFLIDYVLARARVMPKGLGYGQLAGDAECEWKKIQEKVKGEVSNG